VIRFFAFMRYWRKKWEYSETVHPLFADLKKAYDSDRREVLYNIAIEFGISMKLFRLIKVCFYNCWMRNNSVSVRSTSLLLHCVVCGFWHIKLSEF
jgi:hypothetical protein